ncbi:tRNA (adenosine(37)-N6)-dimethylallyltransferase MiaA [Acholeplasma hippikon]|uniref:tRNA dimethylallyltransferase n=1 Tax=Acholeplasma hippikon TaxID=264636 RepID=A0A449BJG9_9MOLU|nr:tRNA (adenosine(37)-N6)-dimethylallyltransferase MiaA [Acholeplasma hippikon]VEU82570.1 tRNA dimethylallyltransferase [Acholeplasma hippikon]
MKKVICIMGPTASGKTKLSIELAKAIQGEIINGDAVQIFKELNIGSAKIKDEEMDGVKHHLLSIKSMDEDYTVYHFQKDAREKIDEITTPIICGGSGLYIKAALYDYEFESFDGKFDDVSLEEKLKFIQENDPELTLDLSNERRIESAYRNIKSGFLRSEKKNKDVPLYDIYLIYLDLDRTILKERLYRRLDIMFEEGFLAETQALMNYDLNIIGYRELKKYLLGEYSLEEAKEEIIKTSMRFAKRQKTWFMNQMKPHVYDALSTNLIEDVKKDVIKFLKDN